MRRVTVDDADALARLNRFVQDLHVAARPDVFRRADHGAVARWFRVFLDRPGVVAWLAEEDEKPVGYALAVVHERAASTLQKARRYFELDQIGVVRNRQGRGVGRALMDHVLEEARAWRADEVVLRSWAFNERAHEAFRRLGFTTRVVEFGRSPEESGRRPSKRR